MAGYNPYNNVFNTLHYVKQEYYTTYFYSKNNTIYYYRKSANDSVIPIYDFQRGICQVFKSKADQYSIDGENSLLIKTEDGKYYVVHNDKHLVVFNEIDGKTIYEVNESDQFYCDFFHPIANVVLPVVRVAVDGITVTLCNLKSDEVHTISWNLNHINKLVTSIINTNKNIIKHKPGYYKFNEIIGFKLGWIQYMYVTNEHHLSYLKGVEINFHINTLFLTAIIELNHSDIICYLDLKRAYLQINGERFYYIHETKDTIFFIDKYKLDGAIRKCYLSSVVFDRDCYYVKQNVCGLMYIKKGEYYEDICTPSAMYPYKNYWIIINHWKSILRRKLAIIDTRRHLMYVWATPNEIRESQFCIQSHILFHYYITKTRKLIFLSSHLDCISIIDGEKIEHIFNKKEHTECEERKYRDITEIVQCYNLSDLIKQVVLRAYNDDSSVSDIKAITHHMNKEADKVYIIARYELNKVIHVGLFVLDVSDNSVSLKLIYDNIERGRHIQFNKPKNKNIYAKAIEKMDFYGIQERYFDDVNKIMSLDIVYRPSYISSTRYNRRSLTFESLKKQYFYHENIKCFSTEFYYTPDNLIVVRYLCEDTGRDEIIDERKFCIFLAELGLVRKMHTLKS